MQELHLDPEQMLEEYRAGDVTARQDIADATVNLDDNTQLDLLKKMLHMEDEDEGLLMIRHLILRVCTIKSTESDAFLSAYYETTSNSFARYYIFERLLESGKFRAFVEAHRHDNYTYNDIVELAFERSLEGTLADVNIDH